MFLFVAGYHIHEPGLAKNNVNLSAHRFPYDSMDLPPDYAAMDNSNVLCPHCPNILPKNSLRNHIAKFHTLDKPYSCTVCNKGFLSSTGFNLHMQAHAGRKFMCSICDCKFNQKVHLKTHLKGVHKLAQCMVCSGVFGIGDEYNQHVLHCN